MDAHSSARDPSLSALYGTVMSCTVLYSQHTGTGHTSGCTVLYHGADPSSSMLSSSGCEMSVEYWRMGRRMG